MATKKKRSGIRHDIISSAVLFVSSFILFVNNLTDFFKNFNLPVNINLIAWTGIAFSFSWWFYLFGKKVRIW